MTTINTNELLKFAVYEKNDDELLLHWIFENGKPTNVEECLKIAISSNQTQTITILAQHLIAAPSKPMAAPIPTVVVTNDIKLDMSSITKNVGKNCTFMVTLHADPAKAYRELMSGQITLEEINYQNELGWTVLHYLCRNSRKIPQADEMIQKLMDLGADINLFEKNGYSVLMSASIQTNTDSTEKVVEMLLSHPKIDVNQPQKDGITSLMNIASHTVGNSTEKTLEMLLKHPKINVNATAIDGMTSLMFACRECKKASDINIIKMLAKHPGIDIYMKNKDGRSAISMCPHEFQTEVFEILSNKTPQ